MNLTRLLLVLSSLIMATPALAQPRTSRRPPWRPPALLVRVQKKLVPLKITRLKVDARVFGYLTRTSMTMTFANPNSRAMEGDLVFPLAEGSTISGYALDIQGKMVDGQVVEKDRGRQVFEKIVRQGIDPGLVEWTKGNVFKTRIFPIPAKGARTVRVDFVSDVVDKKGAASYHLPLAFKAPVGDVSVRLEVVKPVTAPRITAGGLPGLAFSKTRDSYVAEARGKNLKFTKDLVVALPDVEKQRVLVEQAPDGQVYFALNDFPQDPRAVAARKRPNPPQRVTVFWDASASRAGADHKRELRLLQRYLTPLGLQSVDLVVFSHAVTRRRSYNSVKGLLAAIKGVRYDGGTRMSSIAVRGKADVCLVFSDGISNFGKEEPGKLPCPLYVLNGQATANHSFLRYLALRTGGEYFNLSRLSDKKVLASIGQTAFSYLGAGDSTGQKPAGVRELFPSVSEPIHGRFTLVGKLAQGQSGQVRLSYGMPGKPLAHTTFQIPRAGAPRGDLLRRFWAQRKVHELSIFPKRNRAQIVATGRLHGLVTPHTSLIVLERLEQYVEHSIPPPRTLPKMLAKYNALMKQRQQVTKKKERGKLVRILALWKGRVGWWKTRFRYPPNYRHRDYSKKKSGRMHRRPGRPRPSPRPRRRPPRRMRSSSSDDLIRPTGGLRGRGRRGGRVMAKEKKKGKSRAAGASIQLKAWDPKTPYLAALKAAPPKKRAAVYMAQRKKYGTSPAFFLDCGDFFIKKRKPAMALRVLSNVVELELENAALVRVLAHKLAHIGQLDIAASLFEEARRLRPEEPQSHRDLALVLARRAHQLRRKDRAAARKLYERALSLMAHVVMNKWDRFNEIELIALMEFNATWPRARKLGLKQTFLDKRLVKRLHVDVRIIMTWDADNTDMDMHVVEPSREEAYYGHRRTRIGGNVSRDFTRGYGPEEYCLRRAMRGTYTVRTKYFGSSAAKLIGAVTLQVEIFTNYGRSNQKRQAITLRLTKNKDTFTVGRIKF